MTIFTNSNTILHLKAECFQISVERLKNKHLVNKKVIIIDQVHNAHVKAWSSEVSPAQINIGMPFKDAKCVFPDAVFVRENMKEYEQFSFFLTEILASEIPVFEKISLHEFVCDISKVTNQDKIVTWINNLINKVKTQTGLQLICGLGPNKLLAEISLKTGNFTIREILTTPAQIHGFIDSLDIKLLKLKEDQIRTLAGKGIRKIGVLRQMPKPMLQSLFGCEGTEIWNKANGIDNSTILPYSFQDYQEGITVTTIADKVKDLKSRLADLAAQLEQQLLTRKKLAGNLSLTLKFAENTSIVKRIHLSYTNQKEVIYRHLLMLAEQMCFAGKNPVQLTSRISDLTHSKSQQLYLFDFKDAFNQVKTADKKHQETVSRLLSARKRESALYF